MSEYQYYEFQAIDHPLTNQQIRELRAYSSRAEITSASFTVEYNWGDFNGDPLKWMEKYFDAFVHVANWGTRWLMLRVPKHLAGLDIASEYCVDEYLSYTTKGEHVIVSFRTDDEEPDWTDGEGWLASLIQLRADLMRGDYRCLYLGWLCSIQGSDFEDDALEPPPPAGLGNLSAPLLRLADFLSIDFDLIAAAAEQSEDEQTLSLSKDEITAWVANLTLKDKDAALARIIEEDDPHVAVEVRQRAIREIHTGRGIRGGSQTHGRRGSGQLLARAEAIAEERRKKEAELAARTKAGQDREQAERRKKHLESLTGKESELWTKANDLIATKQPKRYDEAVSIIKDLHELAGTAGKDSDFLLRMENLVNEHEGKRTFVDRLRKAQLLSPIRRMTLVSHGVEKLEID